MIPLNRCIQILGYTKTLSEEQTKAIIYYLGKLKDIGLGIHGQTYAKTNLTNIPLKSRYEK